MRGHTLSMMALLLLSLFSAGVARADGWPASVAGTWSVIGNQSPGTLSMTRFPGLAGSQCKPIRGTIYTTDNVEGFYCPNSGRISFVRYVGTSTNPRQFWSGNLSQTGQTLRIGGLVAVVVHDNTQGTVGGSLGEYNFQASM